jgi:acetoin utilization protein AcuB
MNVRKRMQTDIVALQKDEPLLSAVEATASERIRHLPVLDGDRLVGMVSDRDINRAMPSALVEGSKADYARILRETPVSHIMRRDPVTAGPAATMSDIIRLMLRFKISAVPIVEGGKLVGLITDTDVISTFLEVLQAIE